MLRLLQIAGLFGGIAVVLTIIGFLAYGIWWTNHGQWKGSRP